MNQQTLQFMKQTQIAETCKRNAESYFNIKRKPQNPANRPPECQQNEYFYSTPFLNKEAIKTKISNLNNVTTLTIDKRSVTTLSQSLKVLANLTDPKEIAEYAVEIHKSFPNSIIPILTSALNNSQPSLLLHLAVMPIDIREIGPFFALADEINLFNDDISDLPLLNMIIKDKKQFYVEQPSFISTWKKLEPGHFCQDVKRRYAYFNASNVEKEFGKNKPPLKKVDTPIDVDE